MNFTDETVSSSDNLLSDLLSFLFCFLLEFYKKILKKSPILYAMLQNRSTDLSYGAKKLRVFVNFLTKLMIFVMMLLMNLAVQQLGEESLLLRLLGLLQEQLGKILIISNFTFR